MGSRDPTYPLYPISAFFGAIIILIPLPWHLQSWNTSTCFYMIWVSVACLNQFVNSVAWAGNTTNKAPLWCDISIHISLAAAVAIPLCALCIVRRLYSTISERKLSKSYAEKRREVIIDSSQCLIIPLIFSGLQYINQGHRFDIYEDIGCYAALYNTIALYLIFYIWPLTTSLVSTFYCTLALLSLRQRQLDFTQITCSNESLSMNRFVRLICLVGIEILLIVPLNILVIVLGTTSMPMEAWISFEDTHSAFSRVREIAAVDWRASSLISAGLELERWFTPFSALIFFALFGFTREARMHYKKCYEKLGLSRISPLKGRKIEIRLPRKSKHPLFSSDPTAPPQPVVCYVLKEQTQSPLTYSLPGISSVWDPRTPINGCHKICLNTPHLHTKVPGYLSESSGIANYKSAQ